MTPKMGRPPVENPRDKKITIRLTEEEFQQAEEARMKDKKQERSFSLWVARKFLETVSKLAKK